MYNLINELLLLVKTYENTAIKPKDDLQAFQKWISEHSADNASLPNVEPDWSGKISGRSADSVINTTLVHLYRYAKMHAKEAIAESSFSTPDEFIYLINLVSHGAMSKTDLIKENVHDKPAGTLIIKRLLDKGFIEQKPSGIDKRSVIIGITEQGNDELNKCMDKIRLASAKVTGPLNNDEKMRLIAILKKLEDFHYEQNFEKI
ncbi:DNA-binding transcriptional regulator, MarR family [Pedobacter terrae]|uniref:DNA-binding transcriptional regulator, MarR family n=2 Tax=Pedobacter terrae TaxID=405671 RepID=A0A1G7VDC9_9SPHI|nr:DNA-binding transcriptional regulator, MarR family [Pedobacter terrae]